MGGGCRGNKETLQVRDEEIEKGWTGCDSLWGRRLKIEMLWEDSLPLSTTPPHPSTSSLSFCLSLSLSFSLCIQSHKQPAVASFLSVVFISSWCLTICDLLKEDLQWPLSFLTTQKAERVSDVIEARSCSFLMFDFLFCFHAFLWYLSSLYPTECLCCLAC